jgi:hypothetical protein
MYTGLNRRAAGGFRGCGSSGWKRALRLWLRMKTTLIFMILILSLGGCSSSNRSSAPTTKKAAKVRITNFYLSPAQVPKGSTGNLCYGVEFATKVTLDPPVEEVWPAVTRCLQIKAEGPKHYTLTATGADGQTDVRSIDFETVEVVAAPELYDISVTSMQVKPDQPVGLCFKARNAVRTEASPGTYDAAKGCLVDYPKVTTKYQIAAVGKDGQRDTRDVTVKVR